MSVGDWVPPWLRHQHEERYRFAGQFANERRVLDAACGNGYGSLHLRRSGASSVVGLDVEIDGVRQANTFHRTPGNAYVCGSAASFPFPDATFDLFVSLETIEHIDDDRAYLSEARRITHKDGVFICSTPNRTVNNPGTSLMDQPRNRFHVREYTVHELDPLLRAHFANVQWYGQARFSAGYLSFLDRVARWSRVMAVRIHQVRNTLGSAWEGRQRHTPVALPLKNGETEVLIAVCSN